MNKLNKRRLENLDFEISFYEDLIKDKPDFIDVLVLLGDVYTKKGFYRKGLGIDKRLAKLRPNDPIVNYNLACSYSLIGDIESSLKTLKKAIKKGYCDIGFMQRDPDLENVRKDKRFKKIIDKLKKEIGGGVNGIWFIQEEKSKKVKEEGCCKKKSSHQTKTKGYKGQKSTPYSRPKS